MKKEKWTGYQEKWARNSNTPLKEAEGSVERLLAGPVGISDVLVGERQRADIQGTMASISSQIWLNIELVNTCIGKTLVWKSFPLTLSSRRFKPARITYCGVYATNKTGSSSDDWIY
jgi:hypothetical protein